MADKRIGDFATLADAKDDDLLLVSSEDETYNVKVSTLKKAVKEFAEESVNAAVDAATEAADAASAANTAADNANSKATQASNAASAAQTAATEAANAAETANAAATDAINAANAAPKAFTFIYDDSGAADATNKAVLSEYLEYNGTAACYVKVGLMLLPADVRKNGKAISIRADTVESDIYYRLAVNSVSCLYETVSKYDGAIDPKSTNAPTSAAVAAYVEEYTAAHMPEQTGGAVIEEITIPADGWTADASSAYPYRADVTVPMARESSVPVAAIHSESLSAARKAGVSTSVKAVDGAVSFWAEKIPEADIICTVALLGVSAPSADIVLPIATRDTLGVVKIGANLGIETDGTVSASGTGVSDGDIAGEADVSSMLDSVFGGAGEDDPTVPDEEVAGEGEVEEMLNGVFGQ